MAQAAVELSLRNCEFSNCEFSNCEFSNTEFSNCEFSNTDVKFSKNHFFCKQRMNPSLITYALIGAVAFSVLSTAATKYRGDEIEAKNIVRDAFAGAFCTALLLVLVPDMFPQISLFSIGSVAAVAAASSITHKMTGGSDDYDIQVGYMKRR